MLVPLDLRVLIVGRVRVALVSVSASSVSDEEDNEGAIEELVVVVVMVDIVVRLASHETGVESSGEVVMAMGSDSVSFGVLAFWRFGSVYVELVGRQLGSFVYFL